MGEHIVNGEFQSDKYPWCKPGFVPMKFTDPMSHAGLWEYARVRESEDKEFSEDLRECLLKHGYNPEDDPIHISHQQAKETEHERVQLAYCLGILIPLTAQFVNEDTDHGDHAFWLSVMDDALDYVAAKLGEGTYVNYRDVDPLNDDDSVNKILEDPKHGKKD